MSPSDPPFAFAPPRIYVLKDNWLDPRTAPRVERVAASCPSAEVRTFTYADLPAIVIEEGFDHRPRMGSQAVVPPPIPILGRFRFDRQAVAVDEGRMVEAYRAAGGTGGFNFHLAAGGGAFVFFCSGRKQYGRNPEHICRPQWRIHQGNGCPHQCAYCRLGGYIWAGINTEEYIEHLSELLRQNPWQRAWLYDDVMDVPTLEPQLDTLAPLMRFFQSTGDRYLLIHTKSDRVEPFLEADAPDNTIVAWSLAGPTQAGRLERVAGTTESRIEAARRCQQAGITVRYKFKPIVPVPAWRDEAASMIDLALRTTRPDNLSMTVLMWMQVEELRECIPADLLDGEFLAAAEAAAERFCGSRNAPFPADLREQVYRHYLTEIRRRDRDVPVTISTESVEMWDRLGGELGVTMANYVCGCGAGAVPGARRLATDPWTDARISRTWDGQPVVREDQTMVTE